VESLMFLYDGGVLRASIQLAADELLSSSFVQPQDLDRYLTSRLSRRVKAALLALRENRFVELEHGALVQANTARECQC